MLELPKYAEHTDVVGGHQTISITYARPPISPVQYVEGHVGGEKTLLCCQRQIATGLTEGRVVGAYQHLNYWEKRMKSLPILCVNNGHNLGRCWLQIVHAHLSLCHGVIGNVEYLSWRLFSTPSIVIL